MSFLNLNLISNRLRLQIVTFNSTRFILTSVAKNVDHEWREKRGLPSNSNARGVLTDSPDYSFLDGRITPYGTGQMQRLVRQQEVAKQVIELTREVDFAVERYNKLQEETENERKLILKNKLKSKGFSKITKKT